MGDETGVVIDVKKLLRGIIKGLENKLADKNKDYHELEIASKQDAEASRIEIEDLEKQLDTEKGISKTLRDCNEAMREPVNKLRKIVNMPAEGEGWVIDATVELIKREREEKETQNKLLNRIGGMVGANYHNTILTCLITQLERKDKLDQEKKALEEELGRETDDTLQEAVVWKDLSCSYSPEEVCDGCPYFDDCDIQKEHKRYTGVHRMNFNALVNQSLERKARIKALEEKVIHAQHWECYTPDCLIRLKQESPKRSKSPPKESEEGLN